MWQQSTGGVWADPLRSCLHNHLLGRGQTHLLLSAADHAMLAGIMGKRNAQVQPMLETWNRWVKAKWTKQLQHDQNMSIPMVTPDECKAMLVQVFHEMQVPDLAVGRAEPTGANNGMVCHFHSTYWNTESEQTPTTHFHGTPFANVPNIMTNGMAPFPDDGRPELGPIIFCFPDNGYKHAMTTYSPWTWLSGINMFVRAVLCLNVPELPEVPGVTRMKSRGAHNGKQFYTQHAEVVGVDVEVCQVSDMASNDYFFRTAAPADSGPGRHRASAASMRYPAVHN